MAKATKSTKNKAKNTKEATVVRTKSDDSTDGSLAKTLLSILAALVFLFGVGYVVLGWQPWQNDNVEDSSTEQVVTDENAEGTSDDEAKQTAEDEKRAEAARAQAAAGGVVETSESESKDSYRFVAGSAESYTELARDVIARADSSLSSAERVAAETKLTQDAGAQYLEVGDQISIDKSAVQDAVDWAKALSAEQKSAWQYYADMVAW